MLVLILILVLRPAAPPQISVNAQSIKRAEFKIREFVRAAKKGRFRDLEMDESELNGWLSSNLALQDTQPLRIKPAANAQEVASTAGEDSVSSEDLEGQPAGSKIRDVKIELLLDSLRAYVLFDFHGKDLSLELEGNLSVRNGYLHLEPRAGKLGSLPLLSVALENAAQKIFESPENREKLRLPPNIQEVRIVAGNLIVSPRQS